MQDWWNAQYGYRVPIRLYDPLGLRRRREPVRVNIAFDMVRPNPTSLRLVNKDGNEIPSQLVNAITEKSGILGGGTLVFVAEVARQQNEYWLYFDPKAMEPSVYHGIRQLKTQTPDGVRRLDTGAYELELCRGRAEGNAGSKWGIRYFCAKQQGINLIKNCYNALGGVYGPFFTPENGLVNPPAHMIMTVDPVEEGPIMCRYRFHGMIPDGLNPDVRNKNLEIYWTFYHESTWFERTYFLDDYETKIDNAPVRNKMTVGDEIESGKNNLLLSTYRHYDGTAYRRGDLYKNILLERVNSLREKHSREAESALKKLGIDVNEDPSHWHWDNFWRLFCVMEKALPRETLVQELKQIVDRAHEVVWSDRDHTFVHYTDDAIEVNGLPDETIFPLNAQKTCEYSPESGYSLIHYVNTIVPRMQIVQRQSSGWVNWGTNGENEYPELLSGSTICSAYARFDDWEVELDCMETRVAAQLMPLEKRP